MVDAVDSKSALSNKVLVRVQSSAMHWIERFDLFLFDLDGLLVDTERLHFEAYQTLCNRYDYEIPWDFMEYLGVAHASSNGLQEALEPHFGGRSWDELYVEKKKIYIETLNRGELKLMAGVEALLKELAQSRTKRCVVTHSSKEQVSAIKHFLPILKTIPVWITREDYEEPKPAADGYLKALELLLDPGDNVIGFEDSLRGFTALQQTLALPVLICDRKHPQMQAKELQEVIHFSSFSQIPPRFQGLATA